MGRTGSEITARPSTSPTADLASGGKIGVTDRSWCMYLSIRSSTRCRKKRRAALPAQDLFD